jgi:hypothetical protein
LGDVSALYQEAIHHLCPVKINTLFFRYTQTIFKIPGDPPYELDQRHFLKKRCSRISRL